MEQNRDGFDNKNTMYVRMFGGFSIELAGRPIAFSRSSSTKFIQLLQLLFLNREQGISKEALIDALYDRDSGLNNNKNLNNLIYRAKKLLMAAGLPEEEYIALENGKCRWNSSFPVEVDALKFEFMVSEARKAPDDLKKKLLIDAECMYMGEFLPAFSTELWVIERNLRYKKLYEWVVRELGVFLSASGEYKAERALYHKAAKIYPYDEWQAKEMDCLLAVKEYKEAFEVYQNTARLYCEDMGIPPGEELLQRLRVMERQMTNPVGDFEQVKENLREKDRNGAYYCLYPSFLDSCHLLSRIAERSGQSIFLLLISLTESGGREYVNADQLEKRVEELKKVIGGSLRCGDLYTKYSRSQFLVILQDTEQENCSIVFSRIAHRWRAVSGIGSELSYSAVSLLQVMRPEIVYQEQKPTWSSKKNANLW